MSLAFLRSLPKRSFIRSTALLAGSTGLAQIVGVGATPILTRIFTIEEIGAFGLLTSIVAVASIVLSLRLESAIPTPPSDADAADLVRTSALILPIAAFLSAVSIFWLQEIGTPGIDILPRHTPLWVFAILLAYGSFMILRGWLVRKGDFRPIGSATITQASVRAAVQIGAGFTGLGLVGLYLGELVSRLFGIRRLWKSASQPLLNHFKRRDRLPVRAVITKNIDYIRYALPSSFVDKLSMSIQIPLIAAAFGLGAAGLFALTQRVVATPVGLISVSVADVYHNRVANAIRQDRTKARRVTILTVAALSGIGVIVFGFAAFVSPRLFGAIFGPQWADAGQLVAALTPWYFAAFVVGPITRLIFVANLQRSKLLYDSLSLALNGAILWYIPKMGYNLIETTIVLSIVNALLYALYFAILVKYLVSED